MCPHLNLNFNPDISRDVASDRFTIRFKVECMDCHAVLECGIQGGLATPPALDEAAKKAKEALDKAAR